MYLAIRIEMDNDAFEDPNEPGHILNRIGFRLMSGETSGVCFDSNGNLTGRFEIVEE